jgi:hypothetical protein
MADARRRLREGQLRRGGGGGWGRRAGGGAAAGMRSRRLHVAAKMDKVFQEMNLRSFDQCPRYSISAVEFSPQAANGSGTQTEMPIVESRQYLRAIQLSAAAQ